MIGNLQPWLVGILREGPVSATGKRGAGIAL